MMSDESQEPRPCPHCGNPAPPEAELCSQCGARLKERSAGSFLLRSCFSVAAFLFALALGLCGTCFLLVGASGLTGLFDTNGISNASNWGYGLVFAAVGAALLYGAYQLVRVSLGRRS